MSTKTTATIDDAARLTVRLLGEVIGSDAADKVGVRLWNGTAWPDETSRLAWPIAAAWR
jgi:hypothetical protein